jgi:hypothetical protein
MRPVTRRGLGSAGVTVIELLIYVVLASVVMAAVYRMMLVQSQNYRDQQELRDVGETLRGASVLLTWELRQLSAADGDLYSINATSVTLRSIKGGGIMCNRHLVLPRLGLWAVSGDIEDGDSALVFMAGASGPLDDAWHVLEITKVWDPDGGGVKYCAWFDGGTVESDLVPHVAGDTTAIEIGAPFRAFRAVEYGMFQQDGRWWLGRKVAGAASWELLTGPLQPPGAGGLKFNYYDENGAVTANPAEVHHVDIEIRSQSVIGVRQDSVQTRVTLRG